MSMTDPIGDMLTRIRNAQAVTRKTVSMPSSKVKEAIASVLKDEGYILDYQVTKDGVKPVLEIQLKYYQGKPVIDQLQRFSRPGLRQYRGVDDIPSVLGGLGVAIVSTSQGIMSDKSARKQKVGGEVLCFVA